MGFELTSENIATLIVDGTAIFLLFGIFMQTKVMRKRGRRDDKLFFIMLLLNLVMSVADIVTYLSDKKHFTGAYYFNLIGVSIFYFSMILLCMIWQEYCIVRFSHRQVSESKSRNLLYVPGMLMRVLIIVNLFFGFFFYVDDENVYHHGVFYIPMYAMMMVYVCVGFFIIGKYRTGENKELLIPLWIYLFPIALGIVVPYALKDISFVSIGGAMSLLFTHLGSASELTYSDTEGGDTV